VDILTVISHEELLQHVNASGCDVLVNVDYHNDIVDNKWTRDRKPGEGNWVNYVRWAPVGTYVWIYRNVVEGACDDECFTTSMLVKNTGWKNIVYRDRLILPWGSVTHIGIAVSPSYILYPENIDSDLLQITGQFASDQVNAKLSSIFGDITYETHNHNTKQ